jgi:hypothetical protein
MAVGKYNKTCIGWLRLVLNSEHQSSIATEKKTV